jgi:hypothetical protein
MADPIHYTLTEKGADALASLANRERYMCQSRRTQGGQRAELTPRERLYAITYAREQLPVDCSEGFRMKYGSTHGAG